MQVLLVCSESCWLVFPSFILVLLANFLSKRLITYVIHPIIGKTSVQWDDLLIEHKVIVHFSHIVPAAIIHFFAPALFANSPEIIELFQTLVNTYLVVIILLVINCVLNFTRAVWERSPLANATLRRASFRRQRLVINLIGLIFILSAILGEISTRVLLWSRGGDSNSSFDF